MRSKNWMRFGRRSHLMKKREGRGVLGGLRKRSSSTPKLAAGAGRPAGKTAKELFVSPYCESMRQLPLSARIRRRWRILEGWSETPLEARSADDHGTGDCFLVRRNGPHSPLPART